ncbi:MAG: MBL fold metallo-hydrolase [Nitrosopumilus sp.]
MKSKIICTILFSVLIFSIILTPQSFGYGGGQPPSTKVCGDKLCSEIPGGRDALENKESVTITIENEPEIISTEVSDATTDLLNYDIQSGELAIMWLGNHQKGSLEGYASAGFLLRTTNYAIAIDPSSLFLDDVDSLDRLDAIFITHDHGDHFDPDSTILMQAKTGSYVIADPTSVSMLIDKIPEDKLIQIEANEQMTISGITVNAFAAEHPTETPLLYVIEFDGYRIFHGSDSGFVEDLKNIEPRVHVAMVPTGDPSPTASPQVAFEMTQATNPYVVIPMHGSPQQMEEFSNLVEGSGLGTIVTIPSAFEIIIPSEVVPEFGILAFVVLGSGMGMVIYLLRQKSLIQIKC